MGMEIPPTRDSRRRRPSGPLAGGLSRALERRKPAHAVLNTAAGKGSAPLPLDPLGFPHRCSARRRTEAASGTSSSFAAMAVRRRSAKRRSAIAAKPSAAILARFGADCLGVEGAEPPASPAVIPGVGWLGHLSVAQASLGGRLRNASAGTARISAHRAVAAKLSETCRRTANRSRTHGGRQPLRRGRTSNPWPMSVSPRGSPPSIHRRRSQ